MPPRPGKISEVLTEHYRRPHPQPLSLPLRVNSPQKPGGPDHEHRVTVRLAAMLRRTRRHGQWLRSVTGSHRAIARRAAVRLAIPGMAMAGLARAEEVICMPGTDTPRPGPVGAKRRQRPQFPPPVAADLAAQARLGVSPPCQAMAGPLPMISQLWPASAGRAPPASSGRGRLRGHAASQHMSRPQAAARP
jgi:hypothetical protein